MLIIFINRCRLHREIWLLFHSQVFNRAQNVLRPIYKYIFVIKNSKHNESPSLITSKNISLPILTLSRTNTFLKVPKYSANGSPHVTIPHRKNHI